MHPKDSQFSHWLNWFVDPDSAILKESLMLENLWAAASNGKIAVATPYTSGVHLSRDESPRIARVKASIQQLLGEPTTQERTFSRDELTALVGPCEHPSVGTCSECNGKKRVIHDCGCELCTANYEKCEACDGTGVEDTSPECRVVLMWGVPFNLNLLAYILEHAPAQGEYTLRLNECSEQKGMILVIHTSDWDAFLMAILKVGKHDTCVEIMAEKKTEASTT